MCGVSRCEASGILDQTSTRPHERVVALVPIHAANTRQLAVRMHRGRKILQGVAARDTRMRGPRSSQDNVVLAVVKVVCQVVSKPHTVHHI